jgi:hypothetical protein
MRDQVKIVFALVLLAALTTSAYAAQPEPCGQVFEKIVKETPPPDVQRLWPLLSDERESGCILGDTDTTGIRDLYLALHDPKPGAGVAVTRKQLFDQLLAQFDGINSNVCDDNSPACVVGRQKQAITNARDLLANGEPHPDSKELSSWAVQDRKGDIGASQIVLESFLEKECAAGLATAECRKAFEVGAKVARSTEATFQAIVAFRKPIIDVNEEFLTRSDKEWDSYFNVISVQYPWELGINSVRFQKKLKKEHKDPAQFASAPEDKLIVLHPSPGFEYAQVGDEHGTQAAVVLEVFGYERWRWRNGKAVNRMGVSLAASFSDVPGADAIGYGLMFHLPWRNVAVGAMWRDSDAGDSINIVFNADVAALIEQYKNADVEDFLTPPK